MGWIIAAIVLVAVAWAVAIGYGIASPPGRGQSSQPARRDRAGTQPPAPGSAQPPPEDDHGPDDHPG